MAFSLKLPKLSSGPAETLKIIPKIPKVSEIPEIFAEIPDISEKWEMLTLFEDSGDFCGVSGPILSLTHSFLGPESPEIFRRFRNITAQWLVLGDGYLYPSPPPICCC